MGNGTTTATAATDGTFGGFVCFNATGTGLTVDYDVRGKYELTNTALWYGSSLSDMPTLDDGSPSIDDFPTKAAWSHLGLASEISMNIPIDFASSCADNVDSFTLTVVSHATVMSNATSMYAVSELYGVGLPGGSGWSYLELAIDCNCYT